MEKGTKQLRICEDTRHTGTTHARQTTCFRPPSARTLAGSSSIRPPKSPWRKRTPSVLPLSFILSSGFFLRFQPIPPDAGGWAHRPKSQDRIPPSQNSAFDVQRSMFDVPPSERDSMFPFSPRHQPQSTPVPSSKTRISPLFSLSPRLVPSQFVLIRVNLSLQKTTQVPHLKTLIQNNGRPHHLTK
jgi:hypothetical protein